MNLAIKIEIVGRELIVTLIQPDDQGYTVLSQDSVILPFVYEE